MTAGATVRGGTQPAIALLRRLAAALDFDVHLTAGHDLGSAWFEPTQPDLRGAALAGHQSREGQALVEGGRQG